MLSTTVLIVGQGLCGTWLSYYLHRAGIPFRVIDDGHKNAASSIASGIINPVTGRRLVKTWLIDELMPFAQAAYEQFGQDKANSNHNDPAKEGLLRPCNVIDFFSAPDVELAFKQRLEEGGDYLSLVEDRAYWQQFFHFNFGVGCIDPCYLVDVNRLLTEWKSFLVQERLLQETSFDEAAAFITPEGIRYGDIEAKMLIYCNGQQASASRFFSTLPFAPNKGEALIVALAERLPDFIYKKCMSLVPWKDGLYWVGSSYGWKFENALPTAAFRESATNWLTSFCKMPFEIVDHVAGIRPATLERRPFVGFHPVHSNIGILDGMGTKGVSLAPFFAKQLAGHISGSNPILPEAAIQRFSKILSR